MNIFKNSKWSIKSCKDEIYEIKYFPQLIGFLEGVILPNRSWEEPLQLTKEDIKKCKQKKISCDIDIYHEGKKYKQIVLGRLESTKCFLSCPNYEVLNISDWSIHKNDLFIKYASRSNKMKQVIKPSLILSSIFPIRIYIGKDIIPEHHLDKIGLSSVLNNFQTKIEPGSVTARELCLLINLKLSFYLVKKNKSSNYEQFLLATKKSKKDIIKYYKNKGLKVPIFQRLK